LTCGARITTEQQRILENQQRVIRVFMSSTFKDMMAERDHLVKFTFPQLRKLCESRGVVWGEVDLRWGIVGSVRTGLTVLHAAVPCSDSSAGR